MNMYSGNYRPTRRSPIDDRHHSLVFSRDRNQRIENYEYERQQYRSEGKRRYESPPRHYYEESVRERSPVTYDYRKGQLPPSRYTQDLYQTIPSQPDRENGVNKPTFQGPDDHIKIDPKELKKITVSIKRAIPELYLIPQSVQKGLQIKADELVVVRRPGEGTKPIFDRPEIVKGGAAEVKDAEPRMVAIIREAGPTAAKEYTQKESDSYYKPTDQDRIVEPVPSRSYAPSPPRISKVNEYYHGYKQSRDVSSRRDSYDEYRYRYSNREREYESRRDDSAYRTRDREVMKYKGESSSRSSVWGRLGPPERKYYRGEDHHKYISDEREEARWRKPEKRDRYDYDHSEGRKMYADNRQGDSYRDRHWDNESSRQSSSSTYYRSRDRRY